MLIAFLATAAEAQPTHLPEGTREGVGTENERVCYGLAGFKVLLHLDTDLTACSAANKLLETKIELVEAENELLERITEAQKEAIDILVKQNDQLFKQWAEENKARHEAENVPQTSVWVAWGVAGVALSIAAGFGVYAALK